MLRRRKEPPPSPIQVRQQLPHAVRKLTCASGYGGRMELDVDPEDAWRYGVSRHSESGYDSDSTVDSVASDGSQVTVNDDTNNDSTIITPAREVLVTPVTPASPPGPAVTRRNATEETPPDIRNVKRKTPEDMHVLIRWSELEKLVTENMVCGGCGNAIKGLDKRTIGIATEIDFYCKGCKKTACAHADRTEYMQDKSERDFIRRERRIDNYDLNWRLVMCTQLMGESQVGGSIIGSFLDLTREAFRNAWAPMEDALGVEQRRIGQEVVDHNLFKETMGKIGTSCEDGKVRYPARVSYDMGWQKAKKTYDSLSGHGLMIGECTKNVVAFQNYSKVCGFCERHVKKMEKAKTPTVPSSEHHCPKNYDGSSKGMEAKAALECVKKIWTHAQILAFVDFICLDDDASTKAYVAHDFQSLDEKGLPRPTNKQGIPKTAKRDDKGRLPKDHPVIVFLADLSHRIRTYAKYLYALKKVGRKTSEMNDVDCLRLKRNFAWWLFSGIQLSYEEFRDAAMSPVLHHFNDHSKCGTWCRHRDKTEDQLGLLLKYRCKEKNNKLYLQCVEILERFISEEHLRECHHTMSSQKNEAMNKSLMRYVPKDKTYCRTMSLTSRLNLAISIDTLGHAEYFIRLFRAMKFRLTELTFSGLRRMWRKKEYGRMHSRLKKVKLDRRLLMRKKMVEGCAKMEKDVQEGRAYASGIRITGSENENEGEQPAKKRAKRTSKKGANNNKRTTAERCKCGGDDHKRVTSKECPWKGLDKREIAKLCALRKEEISKKCGEKNGVDAQVPTDATEDPTADQSSLLASACDPTSSTQDQSSLLAKAWDPTSSTHQDQTSLLASAWEPTSSTQDPRSSDLGSQSSVVASAWDPTVSTQDPRMVQSTSKYS
jgi:hypothetical protein